MYREMLRHEIEKVQRGEDPIGVMRDPDHGVVDTNHTAQMHEWRGRGNRERPRAVVSPA
jgi:hypothetical protein